MKEARSFDPEKQSNSKNSYPICNKSIDLNPYLIKSKQGIA